MDYLNYTFSSFATVTSYDKYIVQHVKERKLTEIYHTHDFYEIIEIMDGSAEMILNDVRYTLNQNATVFMRPGDKHKFINQSTNLNLFSLSICASEFEFFLNAYDNTLLEYVSSLEIPIINNFQYNYSSREFLLDIKNTEYEYKFRMLLSGFIKMIADQKYSAKSNYTSSVHFAMTEMKKIENLKEGIEKFVKLSGYSRAQLSRIIKKETGLTLQEYIADLRLSTAYNMLILTQESSENIADRVGYSSFSHFSKIFTQKYCMTPAVVRKTKSIFTI